MSGRRRRDGEPNPDDGGAQAVGPRSAKARRDRRSDGQAGSGEVAEPRVRGAWTTPAVVVRRPDGSVVTDGEQGTAPARNGPPGRASTAATRADAQAPTAGRRPRVRPRRIPGAPGAVLITPTLSDAVEGREARRRRRNAAVAAPVTPLPPRPSPNADPALGEARPARPSLRALGGASTKDKGRAAARHGWRGASPARPGQRRRQRVLQAVGGLNFDRLLPSDDAARERRAARLRRVGARLATVGLVLMVIYGVFPVRTWIDQRAATDRARERLAVFERENELLEEERRDLGRDERIEEEARERGMVLPGEESYGIWPAPEEPAPSSESTSTTPPGG